MNEVIIIGLSRSAPHALLRRLQLTFNNYHIFVSNIYDHISLILSY